MRILIIAWLCCISLNSTAQINCVSYQIEFDQVSGKYTVNLLILDGSASTAQQRAQYNAQISIVTPVEIEIEISNLYSPLQNNQFFTGEQPMKWYVTNTLTAPAASPGNNFYAVFPTLSPSSFYNELNTGDVIPLFSFTTIGSTTFNEEVRLFNNEIDPGSLDTGMGGANFANTFKIASSKNIYYSDISEACVTNTNEIIIEKAKIYPNPFGNKINITHQVEFNKVDLIDLQGRSHFTSTQINQKRLDINTSHLPAGIYICKLQYANGKRSSQKIIKIR